MTLAAGLLRDPDHLLSDIAHAVGYSSAYAFANAFKRAYGVAPGRYRRGENGSGGPGHREPPRSDMPFGLGVSHGLVGE